MDWIQKRKTLVWCIGIIDLIIGVLGLLYVFDLPPFAFLGEKIVFEDTFKDEAKPNWSKRIVSKTPEGGRSFLGEFSWDNVNLQLKELPRHKWITISFDFYALKSWDGLSTKDGHDIFTLMTDDQRILARTTFGSPITPAKQTYPGFWALHEVEQGTGAIEKNSLDYKFQQTPADAVYHFVCTIPHEKNSITYFFDSILNSNDLSDESWGLANVRVSISFSPPARKELSKEKLWDDLASGDGAVASKAVDDLVAMRNSAATFLIQKLEKVHRPAMAHMLLNPSMAYNFLTYPWKDDKQVHVPPPQDRQAVLAAFALQKIGTKKAREFFEIWNVPDPSLKKMEVYFKDEEGKAIPFCPIQVRDWDVCPQKWECRADQDGHVTVLMGGEKLEYMFFTSGKLKGRVPTRFWWSEKNHNTPCPSLVTVHVEKGVRISGSVVDDTGAPVPKAAVTVSLSKTYGDPNLSVDESRVKVWADKDGKWFYDNAPSEAKDVFVGAYHHSYEVETGGSYEIKSVSPAAPLYQGTFVSTLKRGVPADIVIKDEQGNPIPNAVVAYGTNRNSSNTIPTVRASKKGTSRVAGPLGGKALVTVTAPGYAPVQKSFTFEKGTEPQKIEFIMKPALTLTGTVTDFKGHPIKGAIVYFNSWGVGEGPRESAVTDAQGKFEWKDAPFDEIKADVYQTDYMAVRKKSVRVGRENLIVLPPPLKVTIHAVDRETGEPIPSFIVQDGIKAEGSDVISWDEKSEGKDGVSIRTKTEPYPAYVFKVSAEEYFPEQSEPILLDGSDHEITVRLKKGEWTKVRVVNAKGIPVLTAKAAVAGEDPFRFVNIQDGKWMGNQEDLIRLNDKGELRLPPKTGDYTLVVLDEQGYAQIPSEELKKNTDIVLQPLGRIRGVVKNGSKAVSDVRILLASEQTIGFLGVIPSARVQISAEVDANVKGEFIFEKVPPGNYFLSRVMKLGQGIQSNKDATVRVESGQTSEVMIGGKGRPVVGKLVLPKEGFKSEGEVMFMGWMQGKNDEFKTPPIEGTTAEEKTAWYKKWSKTEEGKAFQKQLQEFFRKSKNYTMEVDKDGAFRVENVESGEYTAVFNMIEISSNPNRRGRNEILGNAFAKVTVPPIPEGVSDEPLQIPPVEVKIMNRLREGDAAPNFSAKTLEGKEVKLSDLKGKYILLDFWATWCGPCVEEMPKLKEIYKAYGGHKDFVILGLSLDQKKEPLEEYLKKNDIGWTQLFLQQDATIPNSYGVIGIPAIFLIGPDQKIISKNLNGQMIREEVEKVLK